MKRSCLCTLVDLLVSSSRMMVASVLMAVAVVLVVVLVVEATAADIIMCGSGTPSPTTATLRVLELGSPGDYVLSECRGYTTAFTLGANFHGSITVESSNVGTFAVFPMENITLSFVNCFVTGAVYFMQDADQKTTAISWRSCDILIAASNTKIFMVNVHSSVYSSVFSWISSTIRFRLSGEFVVALFDTPSAAHESQVTVINCSVTYEWTNSTSPDILSVPVNPQNPRDVSLGWQNNSATAWVLHSISFYQCTIVIQNTFVRLEASSIAMVFGADIGSKDNHVSVINVTFVAMVRGPRRAVATQRGGISCQRRAILLNAVGENSVFLIRNATMDVTLVPGYTQVESQITPNDEVVCVGVNFYSGKNASVNVTGLHIRCVLPSDGGQLQGLIQNVNGFIARPQMVADTLVVVVDSSLFFDIQIDLSCGYQRTVPLTSSSFPSLQTSVGGLSIAIAGAMIYASNNTQVFVDGIRLHVSVPYLRCGNRKQSDSIFCTSSSGPCLPTLMSSIATFYSGIAVVIGSAVVAASFASMFPPEGALSALIEQTMSVIFPPNNAIVSNDNSVDVTNSVVQHGDTPCSAMSSVASSSLPPSDGRFLCGTFVVAGVTMFNLSYHVSRTAAASWPFLSTFNITLLPPLTIRLVGDPGGNDDYYASSLSTSSIPWNASSAVVFLRTTFEPSQSVTSSSSSLCLISMLQLPTLHLAAPTPSHLTPDASIISVGMGSVIRCTWRMETVSLLSSESTGHTSSAVALVNTSATDSLWVPGENPAILRCVTRFGRPLAPSVVSSPSSVVPFSSIDWQHCPAITATVALPVPFVVNRRGLPGALAVAVAVSYALPQMAVSISSLQRSMNALSLARRCAELQAAADAGSGNDMPDDFMADAMSNPLQLHLSVSVAGEGLGWAAGSVVGNIVLMVVLTIAAWLWASAKLARRSEWALTMREVLRRGFAACGGWVSSYRDAYIPLLQPLVTAAAALVIAPSETGSPGTLASYILCGVGLLVSCYPTTLWAWKVLIAWRGDDGFPFVQALRRSTSFVLRNVRKGEGIHSFVVATAAHVVAVVERFTVSHDTLVWRPTAKNAKNRLVVSAVEAEPYLQTFEELRAPLQWYFVVDFLFALLGGVVTGVSSFTDRCAWGEWCLVGLSALNVVVVVILRPYCSMLANGFAIGNVNLGFLVALFAALGLDATALSFCVILTLSAWVVPICKAIHTMLRWIGGVEFKEMTTATSDATSTENSAKRANHQKTMTRKGVINLRSTTTSSVDVDVVTRLGCRSTADQQVNLQTLIGLACKGK